MTNKSDSNENSRGNTGITNSENVTFGNISGQFAIGNNITQTQTQTLSISDLDNLRKSLLDIQKALAKLDLPAEDKDIVKGDISAAVKEAKKDKPVLSKIKDRFESAFNTIKEADKTIKDVSEIYEPAKKIAKLIGIGISFLV
jgi:chaperonin cofactor prefoldin